MQRLHLRAGLFALVALVGSGLAACGGDDAKDETTATPASSVAPGGSALSDTEYLAVFCTGVTNYREALLTEPREGLVNVVQEYYDAMAVVVPPPDVAPFHQEFLSYLKDALEEPTYLVTRDPPVPEEAVRSRLAAAVASVPECEYPTFLEGQ